MVQESAGNRIFNSLESTTCKTYQFWHVVDSKIVAEFKFPIPDTLPGGL
jgi:hypothetical protein